MARIVMGNRDGAEALRQARSVLTELNAEWPDVQITQRTVRAEAPAALIDALVAETIGIAVHRLDTLPLELPDGIVLAAVARRQEPRSALVARGATDLGSLAQGARVGVAEGRDTAFLQALRPDLTTSPLSTHLDDDLARLTREEVQALLLPAATLMVLDQRNRIDALLEPEAFAPAPGQGALGLLVREDDDLAFELAYTLQHRPSFDRVKAERAFAAALPGRLVGALASVSPEGELALFGAVAEGGTTLQAETSGDAAEAEQLGRELAADVEEQLAAL
jgi:hydroxymethylbilane synthase